MLCQQRGTIAAVGLLDFLRPKDERAIPEPGSPEFEAAVGGSGLPEAGRRDPDARHPDPRGAGPELEAARESDPVGSGVEMPEVVEWALGLFGLDRDIVQAISEATLEIASERTTAPGRLEEIAREKIEGLLRERGVDPEIAAQVQTEVAAGLRETGRGALER